MHGGLELDNRRLKMEIQSREMRVFLLAMSGRDRCV